MFIPHPPQATPVGLVLDHAPVIPILEKSLSSRKSISFFPVLRSTIAATTCVAHESYLKPFPGTRGVSFAMKARTQSPETSLYSASRS